MVQRRNVVLEGPIHVQLDSANAALMMSAHPQKLALLGSVKVSNILSQIFILLTVFCLR